MTAIVRLGVAGALATLATLALAAPVQAAPTAAPGQCTTTRGTIVAVDFGHWGGPIVRGCGVGSSSGYTLLYDGGFTSAGTRRDGPAFICRLGSASFAGGRQYPTAAEDACNATPPESAYWSFWLAPPGATSWRHSDGGATSDHPVAGEVELWTFGGTNAGGTSGSAVPANGLINELRAHNTKTTGGAPATTKAPVRAAMPPPARGGAPGTTTGGSTTHGSVGGSSHGAPVGPTPAESRGTSVSASPDAPPASSTASDPQAGDSPASSSPAIVAAQPTATSQHGSGSVLPVVITVIILAVLGGLAGLSLLRRRRADE